MEWPILVSFTADEQCVIECGGAQMPRYKVTGDSLPDAIRELVKRVTRDAIADEAREWSNDKDQATLTRPAANTQHVE